MNATAIGRGNEETRPVSVLDESFYALYEAKRASGAEEWDEYDGRYKIAEFKLNALGISLSNEAPRPHPKVEPGAGGLDWDIRNSLGRALCAINQTKEAAADNAWDRYESFHQLASDALDRVGVQLGLIQPGSRYMH